MPGSGERGASSLPEPQGRSLLLPLETPRSISMGGGTVAPFGATDPWCLPPVDGDRFLRIARAALNICCPYPDDPLDMVVPGI